MKNKVDIGKLIDKKYSDGSLTIREFNELIDSVLSETMDVRTKLDTTNLEEISQGEDVFDHAFGMGGAENPIAKEPGYGGREPSNVIPDKIAETNGQAVQTKIEPIDIQIPDIFSLITNSEMSVKDDDRILINDIIKNMGVSQGSNWIDKVQNLSNYLEDVYSGELKEATGGIRQAVSNLIFINVLKKISFSIAQPGKLFEYILAPLIHPSARVVGADDQDIVDITKSTGGAWSSYSVKFFTGEQTDLTIKGSRQGLADHLEGRATPITYIAGYVQKEIGQIKFYEFVVHNDTKYFLKGGWKRLNVSSNSGAIFERQTQGKASKFGIWINQFSGQTFEQASGQKSTEEPTKVSTGRAVTGDFTIAGKPYKVGQNGQISGTNTNIQKFINTFLKGENKINVLEEFPEIGPKIKALPDIYKKEFKNTFDNLLDQFVSLWERALKLNSGQTPNFWSDIQNKVTPLFEQRLKEELQKLLDKIKTQQPAQQQAQQTIKEATDKENQFFISIQGISSYAPIVTLNLGNSEKYKQTQLKIAGNLVTNMKNTLDAYKQLNGNIIRFFGTEKNEANSQAGQQAIKNAEQIKSGVEGMMEDEKSAEKQLTLDL